MLHFNQCCNHPNNFDDKKSQLGDFAKERNFLETQVARDAAGGHERCPTLQAKMTLRLTFDRSEKVDMDAALLNEFPSFVVKRKSM